MSHCKWCCKQLISGLGHYMYQIPSPSTMLNPIYLGHSIIFLASIFLDNPYEQQMHSCGDHCKVPCQLTVRKLFMTSSWIYFTCLLFHFIVITEKSANTFCLTSNKSKVKFCKSETNVCPDTKQCFSAFDISSY